VDFWIRLYPIARVTIDYGFKSYFHDVNDALKDSWDVLELMFISFPIIIERTADSVITAITSQGCRFAKSLSEPIAPQKSTNASSRPA
jgi:hypothetical protein